MRTLWRFVIVAVGFALLLSARAGAETASYVGVRKCRACHLKQFQSWEQTKMAKSFELLKPGARAEAKKKAKLDPEKDYTKDEKCLGCHTTGFGKPGGFVSVEKTPDLVGVQCEMCHGPGSEYLKEGGMTLKNKEYKRAEVVKLGLVIPNAETCTSLCHNNKNPLATKDYVFKFEERKKQGTHEHLALKYSH